MYVQYFLPANEKGAAYPLLPWHGDGLTGIASETTPGWARFPPDARLFRRSNLISVTPDGRQIFCFCGGTSV